MSTIYLPGHGVVDLEARRINKVVNQYDERLFAARHPLTGDYAVFIKMSPAYDGEDGLEIAGQRALPIMAFPNGFPHEDQVLGELHKRDAVRRGTEILDEIHRANEARKEPYRRAAADAAGAVAEAQTSFLHRYGHTPFHTSLRKRDPKQRG